MSRWKPAADPYRAIAQRFNRLGVRYVVVGMSGINYYARNAAEMFATLDYDLFLEPTIHNVAKALRGLRAMGFTVGAAQGLVETHADVRGIVRERQTLIASTPQGVTTELLLQISGYTFSELARDAATFTVRGVPVTVGRLTKLLRSKKLAGRSKDRQFLRRYQSLLEEGGGSSE